MFVEGLLNLLGDEHRLDERSTCAASAGLCHFYHAIMCECKFLWKYCNNTSRFSLTRVPYLPLTRVIRSTEDDIVPSSLI